MTEAPRYRIGVLEDDPDLRGYLATIIGQADDMEMAFATESLAEARAEQAKGIIDLWLVDINLPDGNGLDLVADVSARDKVKAIVLTILGDRQTVLEAVQAGADGYLLKDSPPDQLQRSIRATLAGETPISARAASYLLRAVQGNACRPTDPSPEQCPSLTPRELEILKLFSKGLSYRETAQALGISHHTVGDHIKAVYSKLSVHSRAEALFEARQMGLLTSLD